MKKKYAMAVASILATTAVLVGGTLAYLNDTTDVTVNAFSSNRRIQIALREPAWDGYEFTDENYSNGETAKPTITGDALSALGVTQAQNYVPGQAIPKNPMVRNGNSEDGSSVDAIVALKVQYFAEGTEVSYSDFYDAYLDDSLEDGSDDIAFNENWTKIDQSVLTGDVYLYDSVLTVGSATNALFDNVPLSWDITADETTGKLPNFQIKVTAYAIQSELPEGSNTAEIMMSFINPNPADSE